MKIPLGIVMALTLACLPGAAAGTADLNSLDAHRIRSVRINLNPWGAHLGFETEIAGDDARLEALVSVIRALWLSSPKAPKSRSDQGLRFALPKT